MDLSERGEVLGHALAHFPAEHFDQAMRLWREWRRQPGALSWALDEDLPTGAHDDASAHDDADADGAHDGTEGTQYGAEGAGAESDVAPPSGGARALDGAVAGASAAGAAAFRAMRDEAEGNAMAWVMHAKRSDEAASATPAPRAPPLKRTTWIMPRHRAVNAQDNGKRNGLPRALERRSEPCLQHARCDA
jgi:hypothetical protein